MNANQAVNSDELDPQDRIVYEEWLKSQDEPQEGIKPLLGETTFELLMRVRAITTTEEEELAKTEDRSQ